MTPLESPGRLEGKVVFITGAGRGQGRSHAVRLAREGADIIALDLCDQIETNRYPLSSPNDLQETVKEVEELGRGVVAREGDVRDRRDLLETLAAGLDAFGHVDAIVASAGICPMGVELDEAAFVDAVDVDLLGVMNTVAVALPHLAPGASIVATGSTAGLMPNATSNPALGPGGAGYSYAKQTIASYIEALALWIAPRLIRANAIHPTNCNTALLHNDGVYRAFRPDLEHPHLADVQEAFTAFHAMPIPYIEPLDVSNLVLFLVSDESRYVTGQNIRVDAGSLLKWPNGPQ